MYKVSSVLTNIICIRNETAMKIQGVLSVDEYNLHT